FAACLADLPARFLEGKIKASQRIPIALRPGMALRVGERCRRLEILHAHQLFLPALAQFLKLLLGHGRDCRSNRHANVESPKTRLTSCASVTPRATSAAAASFI